MNVDPGTRNLEPAVRAVFFDVDFTLIYPGPTFEGEGYRRFAAAHGIDVDPSRFAHAVRAASSLLDDAQEHVYNEDVFVRYTGRIIEEMGGSGDRVAVCARDIFREWAVCRHFFLYDDVALVLRELAVRGLKIGLISNSHRSMAAFEEHFELDGLISVSVTSFEHGFMKPHPSIFRAALTRAEVTAGESVMVGDSMSHDIEGARGVGMRGVLVHRSDAPVSAPPDVTVIRDLSDLLPLLEVDPVS
jgi:putative hydrolase of the HAD superfamily